MTPTVKLPYQQNAKLASHRGLIPASLLLISSKMPPVNLERWFVTSRDAYLKESVKILYDQKDTLWSDRQALDYTTRL